MTRISLALCFALTLLLTPASQAQFFHTFRAELDQAQAGGSGSSATGTAVLCLNPSATELTMRVDFEGLPTSEITAFHIRLGLFGANGPLIFGLVNPMHDANDFVDFGTGFESRWDPSDGGPSVGSQLNALQESRLHFFAFTNDFPNGDIRGQIVGVLMGDLNQDGTKDLADVSQFVDTLTNGEYVLEADFDKNGVVDLFDIQPFVNALASGC